MCRAYIFILLKHAPFIIHFVDIILLYLSYSLAAVNAIWGFGVRRWDTEEGLLKLVTFGIYEAGKMLSRHRHKHMPKQRDMEGDTRDNIGYLKNLQIV